MKIYLPFVTSPLYNSMPQSDSMSFEKVSFHTKFNMIEVRFLFFSTSGLFSNHLHNKDTLAFEQHEAKSIICGVYEHKVGTRAL